MAAIYSLYIINKSGGLIFYKDYGSAGRMDTNDSLRVASLWHSMHAISQQLSPVSGCFGIELLQADTFDLHCFQSLTGTKFFVVSEPGTQHMEDLLKSIYELYTDYVLKNPFYEMEMPIRKTTSQEDPSLDFIYMKGFFPQIDHILENSYGGGKVLGSLGMCIEGE
ncbi:uncharacterized protein LOC133788329 isoform X2 [Humulus lupulus]|uniref:uncharacterized protein LOC133788329 isoform X2 n=1 Tax=Humulus lupulus TaxID=3486 RepID=UPI002B4185CB|nr:uncharacterized protein LOC133788329 isoform X2 [Humulus lupulus]